MELKVGEIILIVLALAIPIGLFVILLTPGAGEAIYYFVMQRDRMPYIFFGGAALTFVYLAWRIYRRLRPKPRKVEQSPEE
ncbi:MAG TPA: hypothetical protein VGO52_21585 [Hyphomonadaceae bacterium]|jgi:hypothetical protein|nr:hypothetical protein [Hyphomonadaceae bacterium]